MMPETPLPSPLSAASVSSRGHFDVVVGFQRVGTPKLRPLPLKTWTNGSGFMRLLRKQSLPMQYAIRDILIRNGLPAASYEEDPDGFELIISDRYKPYDYEGTREPTIYVTAPWTEKSTQTWCEAAKELKIWADGFLDSHDMEHVNINIEIISNKIDQKKYATVVPPREGWLQGWTTVQARIHDILQSHESAKSNWNCVALVNFGPNVPPDPNPTTVYISLDHACDEGLIARVIQPAIQTYLDQTPFGWRLHIEHSISDSSCFNLQPPSQWRKDLSIRGPYQQEINLGANMSVSNHVQSTDGRARNPMVGTLGCYVQVKIKDRWELFGLTNYHVVRHAFEGAKIDPDNAHAPPAMDSPLYRADHCGFVPNQFPQLMVESPSQTSQNATMVYYDTTIGGRFAPKQDKVDKVQFFDEGKHIMGNLWAGSGFARRTKDGGVLDWALIKVKEERIGRNILPTTHEWAEHLLMADLPPEETWGKELDGTVPPSLISELPAAFKYGAITSATTGICSRYKASVMTAERRYMAKEDPVRYGGTVEPMFAANDQDPFAAPGDSGSIVYNGKGRALGLFLGNSARNLAHVTPLYDVFDDIKVFLGVDIRIAVFPRPEPKDK